MQWWKIFGILVLILLLLGILYLLFQKSSQGYYSKARRSHKKGEKAYMSGDFSTATKYYTKADDWRKKARELE